MTMNGGFGTVRSSIPNEADMRTNPTYRTAFPVRVPMLGLVVITIDGGRSGSSA